MEQAVDVLEEANGLSVVGVASGANGLLVQVIVQRILVALEYGELHTLVGP